MPNPRSIAARLHIRHAARSILSTFTAFSLNAEPAGNFQYGSAPNRRRYLHRSIVCRRRRNGGTAFQCAPQTHSSPSRNGSSPLRCPRVCLQPGTIQFSLRVLIRTAAPLLQALASRPLECPLRAAPVVAPAPSVVVVVDDHCVQSTTRCACHYPCPCSRH